MGDNVVSNMLRWSHLPECTSPAEGWKVRRFTEITNVVAGQSPPSETYNDKRQGIPFLQGNADFSYHFPTPVLWCSSPAKAARKGDTLISVRAPVGEVNRADQDYAIGRGLASIRATEADSDFVHHAIQRWRWSLQRVAQGTTFDAVTARHFSQLLVAVPVDRDEQAAIARILDAVDVAIERAREAVDRSFVFRRSLINELLSNGLDSYGQVRNPQKEENQFKRTPLGLLPRAWRISTIGTEFSLQNGFTLNEARRARLKRRRYLRVANVHRDELRLTDIAELEANDSEFVPRILELNDLLVVEGHADRMQIGRCAIVNADAVGLTFQNHLFRLRSNGEVMPYFGCLWLNSEHAQRYWNARCATSSGLNTINQKMLKKLVLPVPPEPEQKLIVNVVEKQREHLAALQNKFTSLAQLKKSLMHDLLTGTVRVDPSLIAKVATP